MPSTFTIIKNLSNTIIISYINAYSAVCFSSIEDHKGELIEDILLNSNHIPLNTNTPTHLPPNQTQQPTKSNTSGSGNLHDGTSWQIIYLLRFDHLPLFISLSIHHKIKANSHFTKTITNYQNTIVINWIAKNVISYFPQNTTVVIISVIKFSFKHRI